MTIRIEKVTVANQDLIKLVDQLNQFFYEEWGEVSADYQGHHNLAKMAGAVVAYVDKQPAGCGCWKLLDGATPEIKRMFVDPDYRSMGLASQILASIEKDIIDHGHKRIVLETGADMRGAIKFYEKQGYYLIPNYGDFIGDDLCVCMEKLLP